MNNDNDPTTCIHIWKLLMKNMILTNSGLSTCTYTTIRCACILTVILTV